jgi:ABC-type multidrug transport system ATPase subunit
MSARDVWGLEDARVSYGARVALDGVTFATEPSTVTVVVGGDGAGKSTALRALVGLVPLSAGQSRRPAKERIGYVPAVGGIYPDLTVGENLSFAGAAYGLRAGALAAPSADVLDRVGLGDARERLAGHLSGGMQRKLAVAVALLHEPALLVLDEPTTGVDLVSRTELWRLIAGVAAAGTAVALSTTYVREAQRATTMVLLEHGRALAYGAPDEVVASVRGAVGVMDGGTPPVPPPDGATSASWQRWRRGRAWRVWAPDGSLPPGARPVRPDLHDAVITSELAEVAWTTTESR